MVSFSSRTSRRSTGVTDTVRTLPIPTKCLLLTIFTSSPLHVHLTLGPSRLRSPHHDRPPHRRPQDTRRRVDLRERRREEAYHSGTGQFG